MPIIGWLAGRSLAEWIAPVDHWVAFGLLVAIGGKMIYEALTGDDEEVEKKDPTKGASLSSSPSRPASSTRGGAFSRPARRRHLVPGPRHRRRRARLHSGGTAPRQAVRAPFGRRVEILGGVILIGIGVRILIEHLSS